MKVAFRTDASLMIGSGHLMRCLTLAKVLRERGADCKFIVRNHFGNLVNRIKESGFKVDLLPAKSRNNVTSTQEQKVLEYAHWLGVDWHTDGAQTIKTLTGESFDWLVIDHYALDFKWEKLLRPYAKRILVIDDLADRDHDCEVLLDQNLVANGDHRYDVHLGPNCARLLGPHFALVGQEYAALHSQTSLRVGPIQRILIYFGAGDLYNITGLVLDAFIALKNTDIALDVVINPVSPFALQIRKKAAGYPWIVVHEELPSLSQLMLKADLAIGGGGGTSWERCCLGLPSIVITLAENQRKIAAEMHHQGMIYWLGHYDSINETKVKITLERTLQTGLDATWSARCKSLVDGKGAQRVADIISLGPETKLSAHRAHANDEALLLRWANDPLTRANAFNKNIIDQVTHQNWFFSRLRNPGRCQIFVLKTENELPVGQVRFERMGQGWEIHYSIDPFVRKRGIGVNVLRSAISCFAASESVKLWGRVRPDNLASRRIFLKIGFVEEVGSQEIKYSLNINE